MSLPNIPDINPEISLNRKDAINLLLTSIAMEEISISHILNAEGEKIQFVLKQKPSIVDLIKINQSLEKTLRSLIKKEILLLNKLESVLDLINEKISEDDNGADFEIEAE